MSSLTEQLHNDVFARAWVSRRGGLLQDDKAEEIAVRSYLAGAMPLRRRCAADEAALVAAGMDALAAEYLAQEPEALVLNLGCGLDSRVMRVSHKGLWIDLDRPEVLELRREYYEEDALAKMQGIEVMDFNWVAEIPYRGGPVLILAENANLYLTESGLWGLILSARDRFQSTRLAADLLTTRAVRRELLRHPFRRNVPAALWGVDGPEQVEDYAPGIRCVSRRSPALPEQLAALPADEQRHLSRRLVREPEKAERCLYAFDIPGEKLFPRSKKKITPRKDDNYGKTD